VNPKPRKINDEDPPDPVLDWRKPLVQATPFIAMPCYGGIPVEAALSIMRADRELPFPHAIQLTRGDSLVSRARNRLAADFMESVDCTHLLFIDSDVVFEPEHIVRLLSHDEAIVGGLYALKTGAFHWCVDGILKPRQDGLVEVRHTGAGFMAVKREVFERMIEAFGPEIGYTAYDCEGGRTEHDFFRVGVFHEQENKVSRLYSEDWGFCERARELGYKIYVDPKIALKHIGQASSRREVGKIRFISIAIMRQFG
jgi:hypothetical protein